MSKQDSFNPDLTGPLSEQAAHWWVTLRGEDCTQADRREFAEWVAQAPDRVEAYIRVASAMHAMTQPGIPWPETSAEELIREARAISNVERLSSLEEQRPPRSTLRPMVPWLSGMAALLVIAATVFLLMEPSQRYRTGIGEQLSVRLSDGSVMKLNTTTDVEVSYESNRRSVRLISGDALFQVAHDPDRPFDVAAGHVQIRAVGTEFNVNRRDARTTITVLEGRVLVSEPDTDEEAPDDASFGVEGKVPVTLAVADRLVMIDSGTTSLGRVNDPAVVTAWTERRLVFENRPLGEVAEEFNRYNLDQIRIEDQELRQQQVTGMFQADDPRSFLDFIAEIPGVTIRESDGVHAVARK